MPADQRTGAAAVQVQIAYAEVGTGACDMAGGSTEQATSELVGRAVGDLQRLIKGRRSHHRDNRAEDFFAGQTVAGDDPAEDVRADERLAEHFASAWLHREFEMAFLLADRDIALNFVCRFLINDRTDIRTRLKRAAQCQGLGRIDKPLEETVVHIIETDHA